MIKKILWCAVILLPAFGVWAKLPEFSTSTQIDSFVQNIKICKPDSILIPYEVGSIKTYIQFRIFGKQNDKCIFDTTTISTFDRCKYITNQSEPLSKYIFARANDLIMREEFYTETTENGSLGHHFVTLEGGERLDVVPMLSECVREELELSESDKETLKEMNPDL